MRYYKIVKDGCIVMIGTGCGGTEISADEYIQLQETISARPQPPAGCGLRLTEELVWEEYALPAPDPDPELTGDEALDIILGGEAV